MRTISVINFMKHLVSIIFLLTISLNVLANDLKKDLHASQKGNHQKALYLHNKAIKHKNAMTRVGLRIKYKKGKGLKKNNKKAYQPFHTVAKLKDNVVANDLEEGLHATQTGDYQKALPLLIEAAKQKNSIAHVVLGLMYKNGKGVIQNYKEAYQHFQTAADLNDADGQFNLAQMYELGLGTHQDEKEALNWYQQSALHDYADAQLKLGLIYKKGQGVEQDYKLAKKWFLSAALQGDPDAQFMLGLAFLNGQGVEKDLINAAAWLNLAVNNGSNEAVQELDNINKQLTEQQRQTAKDLSHKCATSSYTNC